MFKLIEPNRHCYNRSRIGLFMGLMKLQQNFLFSDKEQSEATFIIAEEDEGNVYGGALLHKKQVRDLARQVQETLLIFIPHKTKVWTCIPFICLEHNALSSSSNKFIQTFYK